MTETDVYLLNLCTVTPHCSEQSIVDDNVLDFNFIESLYFWHTRLIIFRKSQSNLSNPYQPPLQQDQAGLLSFNVPVSSQHTPLYKQQDSTHLSLRVHQMFV